MSRLLGGRKSSSGAKKPAEPAPSSRTSPWFESLYETYKDVDEVSPEGVERLCQVKILRVRTPARGYHPALHYLRC